MTETIKVVCRFRGGQDAEKDKWTFDADQLSLTSPDVGPYGNKKFTFDKVHDSNSTQEESYNDIGRTTVQSLLNGFNGTIFAYGQSGSGKTFTMLGPDSVVDAIKAGSETVPDEVQSMYGVIPRAIGDIFVAMNRIIEAEGASFALSVNYFEIYNESINDLLSSNPNTSKNLKLQQMPNGQMKVMGGSEKQVESFEDIFIALMWGQRSRAVASTQQNDRSSRSHTIFVINLQQSNPDGSQKQGRLNLVDLAGSERIAKTGATGKTLDEAKKINLSLTNLGICIKALTEKAHVPFRTSKLTHFLMDALGGNSKTTLVCTASKQMRHLEESVQTLQFAARAKKIKNKAAANIMRSPKEMEMMIERLKVEVATLKNQLIQAGMTPQAPNRALKQGSQQEPNAAADEEKSPVKAANLSKSANNSALVTSESQNQENSINLGETKGESALGAHNSSEAEIKNENSNEVSFNTLLNDSNLDFEPEKEAKSGTTKRDFLTPAKDLGTKKLQSSSATATSAGTTTSSANNSKVTAGIMSMIGKGQQKATTAQATSKKDSAKIADLSTKLTEMSMRLTEVETEYEHYKTRAQTEIIELREKLEISLGDKTNEDQLQADLQEQKYAYSELQEMGEKLKREHKKEMSQIKEELTGCHSQLKVKDAYIQELEEQNDEFQGKVEKAGFETFIKIKNELFQADQANEHLFELKKRSDVYGQFEVEVDTLMGKYTQQEHLIQQLQANNQDLQRQLEVGLDTGLIKYGLGEFGEQRGDVDMEAERVAAASGAQVEFVDSVPTSSQNSSGTDMMAVISDGGNSELSGSLIQGKQTKKLSQLSKSHKKSLHAQKGNASLLSQIREIENDKDSQGSNNNFNDLDHDKKEGKLARDSVNSDSDVDQDDADDDDEGVPSIQDLINESEERNSSSRKSKDEFGEAVPTMQDLINEAKIKDAGSGNKNNNNNSLPSQSTSTLAKSMYSKKNEKTLFGSQRSGAAVNNLGGGKVGLNRFSQQSSAFSQSRGGAAGGNGSIAFLSEREGSIMEGRDSVHFDAANNFPLIDANSELDLQQSQQYHLQQNSAKNAQINRDSRRSSLTVLMQNRLTDNVHLSALTNQIMELILDNIRLVHLNSKLVGYARDQADEIGQLEQQQIEQQANHKQSSQLSSQIEVVQNLEAAVDKEAQDQLFLQMKRELENLKQKNKDLNRLVEHEHQQFQRTLREKKFEEKSKVNDLQERIRELNQTKIHAEMQLEKLKKDKIELKEDLQKAQNSEKNLQEELSQVKLVSQSATLQKTMNTIMGQRGVGASMIGGSQTQGDLDAGSQGGYQGYLNRMRQGGNGGISKKIAMNSGFLNIDKINQQKNSQSAKGGIGIGSEEAKVDQRRKARASILINPMAAVKLRQQTNDINTSSLLNKSSGQDYGGMGAANGGLSGSQQACIEILPEDLANEDEDSPTEIGANYAAEVDDDLDQLERDLEDSSSSDDTSSGSMQGGRSSSHNSSPGGGDHDTGSIQ